MTAILSVKNLYKIYPGNKARLAVNGISFNLKAGEILGLLGPNGSGKTTTIQMLLGTLTMTSGSIHYFDKNLDTHRSEILQYVSFASAYTSLPWILTIAENLEVFGRLYGLSPKETVKKSDPLLERFGILDKKKARVSSLSAGQITRLMLVKAFFIEPKIALLDEPTASLDPEAANEICEFILEQRDKTGLSVLFTSHKMDEVAALCDRAVVLKEGKILADEIPKKLALSVSSYKLRLVLTQGMEQTAALAEQKLLPYKIEHHSIEITIDEQEIPLFLHALSQQQVTYTTIKIEEPSLENYFLYIARKKT